MKLSMLVLVLLLGLGACAARPQVKDNTTPEELVQYAQEAMDHNRYKKALEFYEIILERFPNDNYMTCTAEYEIAFIHYKQKKYEEARSEFEALLRRYDTPDEELLPAQFKILTNIVLKQIETKTKGKI
ncbi:MAG: tetratricopeptide repeat protein [Treponema sp.]|jgi:outer membrane protein assembly factor BamD (BamD/ComL family)|nr:tetratricopeptide repeat protein [Treponema sp.]